MVNKKGDNNVDKVVSVLKKNGNMTITAIVDNADLSRSMVRISLAKLEGANRVSIRKIGMAKLYSLIGGRI